MDQTAHNLHLQDDKRFETLAISSCPGYNMMLIELLTMESVKQVYISKVKTYLSMIEWAAIFCMNLCVLHSLKCFRKDT